MILCLIMILGVLPIAAGAAEISEVSILGVRQPIAGETFDTSYSIPNGVGYAPFAQSRPPSFGLTAIFLQPGSRTEMPRTCSTIHGAGVEHQPWHRE